MRRKSAAFPAHGPAHSKDGCPEFQTNPGAAAYEEWYDPQYVYWLPDGYLLYIAAYEEWYDPQASSSSNSRRNFVLSPGSALL